MKVKRRVSAEEAGFGLVGAIFGLQLLILISAVIAVALAIDLYLDYLDLDSSCAPFEYLILASIVFSLIAIIASPGLGLQVPADRASHWRGTKKADTS